MNLAASIKKKRYAVIITTSFVITILIALSFFASLAYNTALQTRGFVLGESVSAYDELTAASSALGEWDIETALDKVEKAHEHFAAIEEATERYGPFLRSALIFNKKAKSYYHLAKAGLHSTKAAKILGESFSRGDPYALIQYLARLQADLEEAREPIERAYKESRKIDLSYFTDSKQARIKALQEGLSFLFSELDPLLNTISALRTILGEHGTRRYLILFENSGEIRPTGGFIGSLAIADIKDGKLNKFFVPSGGTYDFRYGLTEHLRSPRPFSILNPEWQIQDCNWFPDFPTSAQKCAWFAEGSIGSSFDGVIAITDTVVTDLLSIIGPIPILEYETVITAENFVPFTQTLVESEEARASGAPKKIIADLFPLIIDRITNALSDHAKRFSLALALTDALNRKNLLLFMEDEGLQKWLNKENWSGASGVKYALDYLHVNTALINGGKSEFAVRQEARYEVLEDALGANMASVSVTREHMGSASEYPDFDALVNRDNLAYIRVYAPFGSVFAGIEGDVFDPTALFQKQDDLNDDSILAKIEGAPLIDEKTKTRITNEFGKTAFGNYMKIAPGEKKTVRFIYKLPFTKKDIEERGYTLFVQKQGGIVSRLVVNLEGKTLYDGELEEDMVIK
ncbi:MAG: hypothetical protein A2249_02980 [Candidatus Jacksonbacteria bacterium RIFOXYA2_FULL_44_7]|uniref:DUF4012 domain-containing protein n=1 Tax=Candidatus Jacksonbacteria bacterium RIFCSPLOWO2_02_FULL_44_20 TaxID=1798460 RepID=A0A1G2A8P3_9BACT|nr:MAG: hypothetical protein UW39_C0016G0004 [Parcubacteria group bacterium GW2011_GWC2_44_17]OGY70006.1 MAG: hypothetical protein A3C00_00920 [Candidatus Jacksonbacteria bacterium RIFCSPHIGHO2_02_FULL_44_25]OGY73268.1 MAG: hypothetical protein A3H61_00855 [Candidatus Jacksonbacteria bacterium RIFCSPLOWO2_02_FULL_44_20]OGY74928.1 MAG: hypothetical protein A3H07_01245 [Candidatus Jacksonbacteria bacterium RIFCSPLOWO2_12_FULL_44_15b]OGY77179.1 MAG: hypothetical protein A2249_02980 [Candidatus Jac